MIVNITEVSYDNLKMKGNSCVTFNNDSGVQRKLSSYSHGISGIITVEMNGVTYVAKFNFSCIGNDGSIEYITDTHISMRLRLDSFMKLQITSYALIKNMAL